MECSLPTFKQKQIFLIITLSGNVHWCLTTVSYQTLSPDVSLLSGVEIAGEKISSIISSSDPKIAHGWDDISINMIKLCDIEIVKPLYLIYKECLETGRFPSSWKKDNVLPIHKKREQKAEEKLQTQLSSTYLWKNVWKAHVWCNLWASLCKLTAHTQSIRFSTRRLDSQSTPLLRIKYILPLKNFLRERQGLCFKIYPKHSIRFGMMVFFLNSKTKVFLGHLQ